MKPKLITPVSIQRRRPARLIAFALHSGANAAREMGGSLNVRSGGTGAGATFILELPISRNQSTSPPGSASDQSTNQAAA